MFSHPWQNGLFNLKLLKNDILLLEILVDLGGAGHQLPLVLLGSNHSDVAQRPLSRVFNDV